MFYRERDEDELFPPWAEPGEPRATRFFDEWNPKTRESVDLIPESIRAFNGDQPNWRRIKGVIPKGTKFKMARVAFRQFVDSHALYYIAIFVDGPFAGTAVVLNRISSPGDYASAQSYDSNYVEPVDK